MSETITILLPMALSNNNAGQTRHWTAAAEQKQEFEYALHRLRLRGTPSPLRQRVTITRILGRGERLWDADSVLRGNAKQLLDALVDAGYFVDDGPRYISEVTGKQDDSRRKDGPAIKVEIENA